MYLRQITTDSVYDGFIALKTKTIQMKNITFLKKFTTFLLLGATVITLSLSSCNRTDDDRRTDAPNLTYIVLMGGNQLMQFHAQSANSQSQPLSITGLQGGESLLSIDFRPATGQLYAVSSGSRIYVINLNSGVATAIGSEPFTPAVNGNIVSIDFNPTVDRIRLVTNTGQNLRLHPETGAVVEVDGEINGASNAVIGGVAYTENFAGSTSTTLYDIDITSNKLFRQDPPNDGALVEIGDLGVDVSEVNGFDISVENNTALASLTVDGQPALYTIDLNSGSARIVSDPLSSNFTSLAFPTLPVAYATDTENRLHIFNPYDMGSEVITKELSGLVSSDHIVGIDFRPLNGQLYALGSSSIVYTVNTSSGELSPVSMMPFGALEGTIFGFDFNPTVDRIRIISNTGQNLRVHPETGELAETDGNLNPGEPQAIATAYTNSFPEAFADDNATTEMFVIDAATNTLFKQDPPNDGTLTSVGPLNIDIEQSGGFDISAADNSIGWGIFTSSGQARLYRIDLTTGAAQVAGEFPATVTGFALGLGVF